MAGRAGMNTRAAAAQVSPPNYTPTMNLLFERRRTPRQPGHFRGDSILAKMVRLFQGPVPPRPLRMSQPGACFPPACALPGPCLGPCLGSLGPYWALAWVCLGCLGLPGFPGFLGKKGKKQKMCGRDSQTPFPRSAPTPPYRKKIPHGIRAMRWDPNTVRVEAGRNSSRDALQHGFRPLPLTS